MLIAGGIVIVIGVIILLGMLSRRHRINKLIDTTCHLRLPAPRMDAAGDMFQDKYLSQLIDWVGVVEANPMLFHTWMGGLHGEINMIWNFRRWNGTLPPRVAIYSHKTETFHSQNHEFVVSDALFAMVRLRDYSKFTLGYCGFDRVPYDAETSAKVTALACDRLLEVVAALGNGTKYFLSRMPTPELMIKIGNVKRIGETQLDTEITVDFEATKHTILRTLGPGWEDTFIVGHAANYVLSENRYLRAVVSWGGPESKFWMCHTDAHELSVDELRTVLTETNSLRERIRQRRVNQ